MIARRLFRTAMLAAFVPAWSCQALSPPMLDQVHRAALAGAAPAFLNIDPTELERKPRQAVVFAHTLELPGDLVFYLVATKTTDPAARCDGEPFK